LISSESFFDVAEILSPRDFYHPGHALIFAAMGECDATSQPIDIVSVKARLDTRDELARAGGLVYIAGLGTVVPDASNVQHYARIVKAKSALRQLASVGAEVVQRSMSGAEEPDIIADAAERAVFEIVSAGQRGDLVPVADIAGVAYRAIEAAAAQQNEITGVATGLLELDRMTAGLQRSDLIILAGRPAMGKSALAGGIAQHAAIENNIGVAIFSLEMSRAQYVQRMFASESRVDGRALKIGRLAETEWMKLYNATKRVAAAPIWIDDSGLISVMEIRAKCRRLKMRAERAGTTLGLVVVDYLQLMHGSGDSREQEISAISRGLKLLAKELDVPVVALSQLNRSLEQRKDKRPILSDLRESGAIEQDADVILFVYRDEVYDPQTKDHGIAEVIIGKQRSGPIGTARARFFDSFVRFENLAPDDGDAWGPRRE